MQTRPMYVFCSGEQEKIVSRGNKYEIFAMFTMCSGDEQAMAGGFHGVSGGSPNGVPYRLPGPHR